MAVLVAAIACSPKTDWAPAGDHIKTRWAAEINPSKVWSEYPRPNMVRGEWRSLNGLWRYAICSREALQPESWDGQILVPFAIESSLSGVAKTVPSDCALWYKAGFKVPKKWKGKNLLLHFDAIDYESDIYINGKHAVHHTGGYSPIILDATDFLGGEVNEILVKVIDDTDSAVQPRGKQVNDPQGIWYTPVTGIWQSVWMEPVEAAHINSYYTETSLESKRLTVCVDAEGTVEGDVIAVEVLDGCVGYSAEKPSKKVLAKAEGDSESMFFINLDEVNTWSPDFPYLYGVKISIIRDGKAIDVVEGYAGMREIAVVEDEAGIKRMALNGEPLFQYGPLDQGWWPDGLYTAPSDEALLYDITKTKDYGFNMIRKHIKVEPARWFTHCDREGILVWQDMPCLEDNHLNQWLFTEFNAGTDYPVSDEQKAVYYKEWTDIINEHRAYPSVVVWVPFNEAWAQFDTEKVAEYTKNLDPTRLVNPASGGNHRPCGDILDMHHYPEPYMFFKAPDYCLVLGEYGGIGCPVEGHLWKEDNNWGYVKFEDFGVVTDKYVEFTEILKGLVKEGFSAAVYTQTTDVEIEVNGLMTYDREIDKLDVARVSVANKSVIESM